MILTWHKSDNGETAEANGFKYDVKTFAGDGPLDVAQAYVNNDKLGDTFFHGKLGNGIKAAQGLCESHAQAVQSAVDAALPKWIRVEEGLPELDKTVLIAGPRFGVTVAEWCTIYDYPLTTSSFGVPCGECWSGYEWEDVTHWMPLPNPPTRKES